MAKRKQTKRVNRKNYYSPQSKNSISLEVGVETNLFQIQLLEILYVLVDTRYMASHAPRNELPLWG
jgi:hypothetical protein